MSPENPPKNKKRRMLVEVIKLNSPMHVCTNNTLPIVFFSWHNRSSSRVLRFFAEEVLRFIFISGFIPRCVSHAENYDEFA